jgi:indole-3-glycerol phosphate synthase
METYLGEIMAFHRRRSLSDTRNVSDRLSATPAVRSSFFDALSNNENVSLIAEIKRKSPSKGYLNQNLDVPTFARVYSENGASAISVLTDTEFFGGSPHDLMTARDVADVSLLRKDFIVSKNDVLDSIEWGASAILLIVAALQKHELMELFEFAQGCGIDVLVECHTKFEVETALAIQAPLIGINQRNLESFEVDTQASAQLISEFKHEAFFVAESGLQTIEDVNVARDAGFQAVLVGESLVTSPNVERSVREFSSVRR